MKKFLFISIITVFALNCLFSCASRSEEYWFGKEEEDFLFTFFSGVIEDKIAYKNRRREKVIQTIWESGYPLSADELNNMSFDDLKKTADKVEQIDNIVDSNYYLKRSELNKLSADEVDDIMKKLETIDNIMESDYDLSKLGLNYDVLMRMSKDDVYAVNSKIRCASDLVNRYEYYHPLGFDYPNSVEELFKMSKEELEELDDKAFYAWTDTDEGYEIYNNQVVAWLNKALQEKDREMDILARGAELRLRRAELTEIRFSREWSFKEQEEVEQIDKELEELDKKLEEIDSKALSSKDKAIRRQSYK